MSSGVRELRVWQEAVALGGDVVRLMRQTVRRETRVVSDAVMATAMAVGSHVADGYARYTPEGQRDSYLAAKRALLRLDSELAVARHADLLPAGSLSSLSARSHALAKMLTGYLIHLDRQIAEREATAASPGSGHGPS